MFPSGDVGPKVRSLHTALASLCAELDPDRVPLPEAAGIWSCFDRIERLAAGAKGRMARKVEESRVWQANGDRTAAGWMARRSGTSTGQALSEIDTSKRLAKLAATDKAVARGELSAQQAEAVADAASADPSAEQDLLGIAQQGSLRDLKSACQRTKARVEDDQARARRLHDQRAACYWTGADGSWNLHVRNAPEVGAQIEAVLRAETEQIFTDARLQGRREPLEAYRADALTALVLGEDACGSPCEATSPDDVAAAARRAVAARRMASYRNRANSGTDDSCRDVTSDPDSNTDADSDSEAQAGDGARGSDAEAVEVGPADGATSGGRNRAPRRSRRPDTKVIVLVDYQALRRGHTEPGETCEIAGVGPVPVATVRGLLGDSFGAAIVTDGVDVYTVAHLGRSATAHQRTALEARGYCCEVPAVGPPPPWRSTTSPTGTTRTAPASTSSPGSAAPTTWPRRTRDGTSPAHPANAPWHPPDKPAGDPSRDPPHDPPAEGSLFADPPAA
jgi:hypothetical protein